VPRFRRDHFVVDETFIDEDGAEAPLRIVEPEDVSFGPESMTCHFASGESVLVRRTEVTAMGVNPYKSTVLFVGDDGCSISMPEHVDDKLAIRWFKRGLSQGH
jgi:hypothetical protein